MSWSDFFKKNFQLILASLAVLFYSTVLRRQKKKEETIDSLRTELALKNAKLKVADLTNKQNKNSEQIEGLKEERKDILSKLQTISEQSTDVDLEGEDLAKLLTEEMKDEDK